MLIVLGFLVLAFVVIGVMHRKYVTNSFKSKTKQRAECGG